LVFLLLFYAILYYLFYTILFFKNIFKPSLIDLQTTLCRRYFTESCKIFTAYVIITDVSTNGMSLLVFHIELQNIYCICHNHRHLYSVVNFTDGTTGGMNLSVYFQWECFFFMHFLLVKPFVFIFFTNWISDRNGLPMNVIPTNVFHRWLVSKIFTDE
jgi:hypothetical protein